MKKIIPPLLSIVFLLAGCNLYVNAPSAQAPIPPVTITDQTAADSPTTEIVPVPVETSTPLQAVTLPPPALSVCSEAQSTTGCEVPTARELDRFCVENKPYTLYAFPPNTRVEAVTPNFTCNDEGLRKGNRQYSCTGTPSYTFKARVCNTACVAPVNQESEQCPRGYGVNTANNCCVPVENTVDGCVEINMQVGQCGGG